jgi:ankyrin repeat protein
MRFSISSSKSNSGESITAAKSPSRPFPLHEAAKNGDVRSLRKALRPSVSRALGQIDVNELDDEDRTALHYASTPLIAEKLLNAGAVVDIEDADGRTPLHRAAAERRLDMIWLLLVYGASTDSRDDGGKTPLAHAEGCEVAEWMLRHKVTGSLIRAAETDRADIVQALLAAGAEKEVKGDNGYVALINATLRGSWAAARVLIEHGADTDVYADMGNGVIHMAAHRAPVDFMRFVLDRGLPINYVNHWGGTPLFEACERDGRDEVVAMLLERGADPAPRNNAGYTALQISALGGKTNYVKMILSSRAEDREELLVPSDPPGSGASCWSPLAEASYHGHPDCVRLLLEAGSEVGIRVDGNNTPLHLALWPLDDHRPVESQIEVIRLLLEHGALINAEGEDEMTPLAAACRWGSLPLVQFLIDAGAEVDSVSWNREDEPEKEFGYTNLMLAVAYRSDDYKLDVLRALIKAGADVNARTYGNKNSSAIEMAEQRGRADIVFLLEDAGAVADKPRHTPVGRGRR